MDVTAGNDNAVSAITNPPITNSGSVTVCSATLGGNAGHQFGQRTRSIGVFQSGPRVLTVRTESTRIVSSMSINTSENHGFAELDSHADTCTVGANFRAIAYTEKSCSVAPFHPQYQSMQDIQTVQAATAYTDTESGETFILIINQALYLEDELRTTLINPN